MDPLAAPLLLTAIATAAALVTLCVASTTTSPRAEARPAGPLATGILEWLENGK